MITHKCTQPIGIFDSGIGGLTIAQAIAKQLPKEEIIYFGDTAHFPYGEKSAAAIQSYSIKIADMLLKKHCKLILIACHSASAAAFTEVKTYVGPAAIVINMIDPIITLLKKQYSAKHIGLIGTKQTVHSNVYHQKIQTLMKNIQISACATNLLAPAIEEFGDHPIVHTLLQTYLAHPNLKNIDALILACTHYHIVKQKILDFYRAAVPIIDCTEIVANTVKAQLRMHNLLNANGTGLTEFLVSDYTFSFANNAKLFFDRPISLIYFPLW